MQEDVGRAVGAEITGIAKPVIDEQGILRKSSREERA
jgi:hypothetical protein